MREIRPSGSEGGETEPKSVFPTPITVPRQPRLSDLLWNCGRPAAAHVRGRSDKRACLWTVEVERELETPQHLPPKAATGLSFRLQKAVANVNGTANGLNRADAH